MAPTRPPAPPGLQAVGNDEPLYFWRVAGEAYLVNTKPGLQNPLARQVGDLVVCGGWAQQAGLAADTHQPAAAVQCSLRRVQAARQSAEEPFSTSPCPALLQLADLGFSSENGFQPNEASDLALEALSHAPAIAAQLIEAR